MCRVLMYRGKPVLVDNLLYQPDNSLIRQTHESQMLDMLNLAGFGMLAWDPTSVDLDVPFEYRTALVPIFDRNLKALAVKLRAKTMIAHVRGVPYHERVTVGEQNAHPFRYAHAQWALAHNGDLASFDAMRFSLVPHMRPEVARNIRGNTDSEWIYALFLSQLDDPYASCDAEAAVAAVERTLAILREVRTNHGIDLCSPINLFLSDGSQVVVVRYCFDFGCYEPGSPSSVRGSTYDYLSLWYTTGAEYGVHDGEWKMIGGFRSADSLLIASEPLTRDTSTWLEVPEYSALYASEIDGGPSLTVKYLDA